MKVLHLATVDNGGGAWFCADALNQHSEHQARAVRTWQSSLDYPSDVLEPSDAELAELYRWADLVHVHDEAGGLLIEHGYMKKPVVITWHGTKYRRHHDLFDARCKKRGWKVTASTLDLCKWDATWLPMPRPDLIDRARTRKWPLVMQAPTDRARKKTAVVEEALRGVFKFYVIEGMTWAECLDMKKYATILVDGWLGYGNNAVEAWALGIPVVSAAPDWLLQRMQKAWGAVPFAPIKPANRCGVLCAVARLVQDADHYAEVQARGRAHYLKYHTPEAVAARLCALYRQVRK